MKKYSLLSMVVLLFVASGLLYELYSDEHQSQSGNSHVQIEESVEPAQEQSAEEEIVASDVKKKNSAFGFEACLKKEGLREEFLKIYQKLESLGLSGTQLAGQGSYQQMPLESLRSYAQANDVNAMYLYGLETMYKASLGIYMTLSYHEESDAENISERARNHNFDKKLFNEGKRYLYQAAVQGKVIGLGEISALHRLGAEKLSKQDVKSEVLHQFVAEGFAYTLLAKDIVRDDEFLIDEIGLKSKTFERYLKQALPGTKIEQIKSELKKASEESYLRLKDRWDVDRTYQGLEVYPDIFTESEEQFYTVTIENKCG
ncbi:hypothetical protein DZA50_00690 [Kangiella sp. HD9-110m-PIT-SAG07]|nr:hypothetical protein DZA50_00690 [Kangiella sp. HD9-110m-PIT-SAG07]